MQFMLLLKGDPTVGEAPPAGLIEAMGRFNAELTAAGVLLAAEGLYPSGMGGAQVIYQSGSRRVVDGPFAEAKELIAGYFMIDVTSREEAIEWASRCPVEYAARDGREAVVEVRQVASSAAEVA